MAIRAHEPNAKLVIVGDGPMREQVQSQFTGAHCVGVQRGEALAATYASSDVFLFPSLSETYGNVVPEAMASGLAVLAFDEAAAHEWIEPDVSGVVVPSGHSDAFVQLACELATRPEWRESLRRQARQAAMQRDWQAIFETVESHWHDLLPREKLETQPFSAFHFG
jgi:glycosyltransferase involved in cell wall biosynthesis